MAFELLEFDRILATDHISLSLRRPADVATEALNDTDIPFQFPPIIKSDNKMVEYEETSMANIEPMVTFKSSKARTIALKWTYVVTGTADPNVSAAKPWNCAYVAKQVKTLRSYFYQTTSMWAKGDGIFIGFRGYDMVGIGSSMASPLDSGSQQTKLFTFRADGIKVSYSPTVVKDSSAIFALKTDLEMTIKLWSKGEDNDGEPLLDTNWLKFAEKLKLDWR